MRKWSFVAVQLLLLVLVSLWAAQLEAATVTVTFAFTRVVEVNCNEGVGEACPDDDYPKVDIDGQGLDDGKGRFCCAHDTDFQPNWVFSRTVDASHNPVTIHVELWDQDDLSGDDQINITSVPNKSMDVFVDMNNCTWRDTNGLKGFVNTQSLTTGNGKDSAKVYFTINSTSPNCVDSDGDGLLDGWEKNGFDADGDGVIDVNLPAMGANPQRKDLFLQIDYLQAFSHNHQPIQGAIQQVVQAFANAPVSNPDGTTGIQLHVDVGQIYGAGVVTNVIGTGGVTGTYGDYGGGGNKIPEAGNQIVDYDGPVGNPGTNFFTLKKLNPNRDNIFRYVIFVHQTNARLPVNDCTSGLAKGIPGVNFMVSLGGIGIRGPQPPPPAPPVLGPCWGVDATGNSVGLLTEQAGTLMHEFGHTLGLQHGGNDSINNKPNYLSVLNYAFQACQVPVPKGLPDCDYSRVALPPLNENSLDECQGVDSGVLGLGPVDFNANKRLEGVSNCQPPNNLNVSANINNDSSPDTNNNGVLDPGESPNIGTLNGFQDWNAIVYNFRTVFDFTTAGTTTDQEPDPQTIESSRNALKQMTQPKLKVEKTGPADARPGDTISYKIKLENKLENSSQGPALNVALTDTKPDLSTQLVELGTVVLGATINKSISYLVPCTTADGTALRNSVQAKGADLVGNPVSDNSSVQTVIHAPVMVLTKRATDTVNAGEAITYTIVYENTGSGAAANVVVTDTVPKDVYYSLALDQGTGPRPTSVTLNGDGTRTLVWNVGAVAAKSEPKTITFTARPTLLALGDTVFTNNVSLTFQNDAGCVSPPVKAAARTSITVPALVPEPRSRHDWKEHAHEEPEEILARIQATDQRYDGRDGTSPDGALTLKEVKATLKQVSLWALLFKRDRAGELEQNLLALYFNLATRRLNAGTPVLPKDRKIPGLTNVREVGLYANDTLLTPFSEATENRYHAMNEVLEEIND